MFSFFLVDLLSIVWVTHEPVSGRGYFKKRVAWGLQNKREIKMVGWGGGGGKEFFLFFIK